MGAKVKVGSWPHVIAVTEDRAGSLRLKVAELDGLVAMFRRLQAAGEPSPADLLASAKLYESANRLLRKRTPDEGTDR